MRPIPTMDDLVHDDHTRRQILTVEDLTPNCVWKVTVAPLAEGEQSEFIVARVPGLDQDGRHAYSDDLDMVLQAQL